MDQFDGVEVFSATMNKDRLLLGEKITLFYKRAV